MRHVDIFKAFSICSLLPIRIFPKFNFKKCISHYVLISGHLNRAFMHTNSRICSQNGYWVPICIANFAFNLAIG